MKPLDGSPGDQSSERNVPQAAPFIVVYSDAAAFERLHPEWEALRSPGADQDPFLSCDWFACWWRAFGGHRKLFLVTARRQGQLVAVLPLMLERVWRHGIPLRRLAAIGNDHSPRFDLVLGRDDEMLHRSIWNHLMARSADWDVLDFPRLSADSSTLDRFTRLARQQKVRHHLWTRAPRSPWIDIQPSWEHYLDARSPGFRKTLRRKTRRLAELGTVRLETVTDDAALEHGLAEAMQIEAEGLKGSNRTAMSSQPAVIRLYSELARIMAARGQLRLHFLTLDHVRIAFDYSLISNRCLYSLKAGHRSTHAHFSPGTLMLSLILQQAHEDGLTGMDLMGDADEFKMHWTDAARAHQWLHCYSDSLRGRLLHGIKCRLVPAVRAGSGK